MTTRPRRPHDSLLRRFRRSDRGAVAPLLGLMMLVLIGCVGLGVDIGRSVLVKARLGDALDAAGLAVGARLATTDFNADALRFVSANFKANYSGATVTNVTATPNASKSVITLTATATMPTAFMKLFGTDSVTVKASSEVTRKTTGLELVLALDNTGSMSGSMTSLKNAANSLIDILFGSDTTATNLFIGLAPFSHTVNIGTSRSSWVNFVNSSKSNWKGCVMARSGGLDQTDDPPSSNAYKFTDYYYPSKGGSLYCPKELTPMTNVKATIKTAVGTMTADGNTHINLGAVWGWRMISPSWRTYWGTLAWNGTILPLNYETKNMNKAMVLMTDGDNTMSSTIYTAYGYLSEGNLGTRNAGSAETELDTRLTTVCGKIKAKGILLYTIAFNNPAKATKSLLQSCATTTAYYFDAGDSTSLTAAFQTIAGSLSNLRVSK